MINQPTIDPDASFSDYLHPMLGKLVHQAFAGPELTSRLRDSAVDAALLTIDLPQRINRVLGDIEHGNLRVWTRVEDLEPLVKRLERVVARSSWVTFSGGAAFPYARRSAIVMSA